MPMSVSLSMFVPLPRFQEQLKPVFSLSLSLSLAVRGHLALSLLLLLLLLLIPFVVVVLWVFYAAPAARQEIQFTTPKCENNNAPDEYEDENKRQTIPGIARKASRHRHRHRHGQSTGWADGVRGEICSKPDGVFSTYSTMSAAKQLF